MRPKKPPSHLWCLTLSDAMVCGLTLARQELQGNQYILGGANTSQLSVTKGINVFWYQDDKKQDQAVGNSRPRSFGPKNLRNSWLALELLSGCGMILGARLLTSPADGRCRRLLNFRVHYSSVIFCNVLNLSGGSRV